MAQPEANRRYSTASTSGIETKTLLDYTVPLDSSLAIDCVVVGREGTTKDCTYVRIAALFKNVGGTVTKVGSTQEIVPKKQDTSFAATVVDIVISGGIVQVAVTGDTGLNIIWLADITFWIN